MENFFDYITESDYERAEKNGIPSRLLEQRVWDYGWDVQDAVEIPKKVRICRNALWNKWKDIALGNGISREIFVKRVTEYKWEEDVAATKPKKKRGKNKRDDVRNV